MDPESHRARYTQWKASLRQEIKSNSALRVAILELGAAPGVAVGKGSTSPSLSWTTVRQESEALLRDLNDSGQQRRTEEVPATEGSNNGLVATLVRINPEYPLLDRHAANSQTAASGIISIMGDVDEAVRLIDRAMALPGETRAEVGI